MEVNSDNARDIPFTGLRFRVRFAIRAGGKEAARRDWQNELSSEERGTTVAWLTALADTGIIGNPKRWKKVTTMLWQLRTNDVRLLCCWGTRELVICAVIPKSTRNLKQGEFKHAERIFGEDIGE